jgi:integrase
MSNTDDPDYVSGAEPPYKIQPPIVHPPFCVCKRCATLPLEERAREHVHRIFRASPVPKSRVQTAAFAIATKRDVERRLLDAAAAAMQVEAATAKPRLAAICAAYVHHQERDGKRIDVNIYTVRKLETYFGPDRDPTLITKADHAAMVEHFRALKLAPDTIGRHTRILLAILNSAVKDGLIPGHQLQGVRRPIVKKTRKPVTFTTRQIEVLRGPAMDRWEAAHAAEVAAYDPETNQRQPTVVPLRGFCMVAYRTLMRPGNNFGLEWPQLILDEVSHTGRFRLDQHKNVSRGVEVEGALHRELVDYLIARQHAAHSSRFVHPNPVTGLPYVNIRWHWLRLCEIANDILHAEGSEDMRDERLHFYTWRHTGASRLAESGADPVMIVRMMGDVDLETVRQHYFDSSIDHMQRMIARWD